MEKGLLYSHPSHNLCPHLTSCVKGESTAFDNCIDQDFFARDGKKYSIKRDFFDAGSSNVWLGSTAKEFMVKVFSTLKVMVVVMMMVVDIMMMMLTTIMVMAVVIYNWRLWLPPAVVIAAFAQDLSTPNDSGRVVMRLDMVYAPSSINYNLYPPSYIPPSIQTNFVFPYSVPPTIPWTDTICDFQNSCKKSQNVTRH